MRPISPGPRGVFSGIVLGASAGTVSGESPGLVLGESSGSAWGGSFGSVLGGSFFEIVFILIVFVCILFLAYIVTRFVAGRASGRLKSRHIEAVDTLSVGTDAQLMIIKVGEEYFLVSKSQKQFAFLTKLELTSGDVEEAAVQTTSFAGSFRSVLESKLGLPQLARKTAGDTAGGQSDGLSGGQPGGQPDKKPDAQPDGENGTVFGFRDNIDRLKNLSGKRNE